MWIFATRSRPENCKRFIEAWIKTKSSTPVYLRIDIDDPFLEELKQINWPKEFEVVVGPREGLRAALNEGFAKHPDSPWYGLLADDLVPRTEHWDKLLVDRAGLKEISYPNDLGGKPRLPTHPVVGGDLVREVGWFGFPKANHLYLDTAWKVIGEGIGKLHRLEHIVVEHVHPFWDKAPKDLIYSENKKRAINDKEEFLKWSEQEAPAIVSRLKSKGF
jgi:hypothetical protein